MIAKCILGVRISRYRLRTSSARDVGYNYYFGPQKIAYTCLTIGKEEIRIFAMNVRVLDFWTDYSAGGNQYSSKPAAYTRLKIQI
jgi:hypothetical protein